MRLHRHALLTAVIASLLGIAGTATAANGPDVPGGKDHPLVSRFAGSWLVGYQQREFDAVRWSPDGLLDKRGNFMQIESLEGRVTRLVYVSPQGKAPLEVFRNYEQALTAAGFQRLWSCERDCSKPFWALREKLGFVDGVTWANGVMHTSKGRRFGVREPLTTTESRIWVGKLARPDGSMVALQLVSSIAAVAETEAAAAGLLIVEPKAMLTGQVTVDANALQKGIEADGRIALYGLLFDTGKAEIKPESKAQLDEMARLLQAQPQYKVFIVGHTDNVGALDANQALSTRRAEAVVAALAAAPYKIDPKRMLARGVANVAPAASNAGEPGRARNRRVELVLQ